VREHLGSRGSPERLRAHEGEARAHAHTHVHATTANISCHVENEAIRHHPLVIRVQNYTRARRRRIGGRCADCVLSQ